MKKKENGREKWNPNFGAINLRNQLKNRLRRLDWIILGKEDKEIIKIERKINHHLYFSFSFYHDLSSTISSFYSFWFDRLDGNIGCMVNGAGLAMATMDIIQQSGFWNERENGGRNKKEVEPWSSSFSFFSHRRISS